MTKEEAREEVERCRASINWCREYFKCPARYHQHTHDMRIITYSNDIGRLKSYFQDKINKLKQKYFFTEQI
jgi:hypothetical protein